MNSIVLQHTELTVSPICLGSNQFGTALDEASADAILGTFADLGGNFIDTARSYGDWMPDAPRGASEACLGTLLKQCGRDRWVVATKGCEFDYRAGDFALRVTPACLREDLEASLKALQTDYVDLYWLHRDDPSQPVAVLLDALIAEQQAGRIRYFGCSNWSPARIAEAQACADSLGHPGFVACQPLWGLAEPDRDAMLRYCPGGYYEDGYQALHASGLTMIPYSSQSRGYFSKVARDGEGALSEELNALYANDRNRRRQAVVERMAEEHGVSVNQVVLGYMLSQPLPTIPLVGASRPGQLEDTAAACQLKLSAAELAALRDA